jgi:hypothetical protein
VRSLANSASVGSGITDSSRSLTRGARPARNNDGIIVAWIKSGPLDLDRQYDGAPGQEPKCRKRHDGQEQPSEAMDV